MDLKLAYNKIDNLCCDNNNVLNRMHTEAEQGFDIPVEDFDFFKAYKDTHGDEDFCEDANEMIDALETIKEVVDLQDDLGCPLKAFFKAFNGIYIIDDWHDLYFAKPIFIDGKFKIEQHYGVYDVATYYLELNDYKKTWWLKEDRSE